MYDKHAVKKYSQSIKGIAARRRVDKKRTRRRTLYHYGLTEQQYDDMLAQQNQVCAACGQPERRLYKGRIRYLSVDHCHTTGKVRGLLCYGCNSALGFLCDNPSYVERLLQYIRLYT